jgi:hypothetical protein
MIALLSETSPSSAEVGTQHAVASDHGGFYRLASRQFDHQQRAAFKLRRYWPES